MIYQHNLYSPTDTGVWSLPAMSGATVVGRMGHSSSYDQLSGLIYVHGGALISRGGVGLLPGIITLDPSAYSWSILTERYVSERMCGSTQLENPIISAHVCLVVKNFPE